MSDTASAPAIEYAAPVTTEGDYLSSRVGSLANLEGMEGSPIAEVVTSEAPAAGATPEGELSLEEQLKLHDELNPETTTEETPEATTEDGTPDWTSEKLVKLTTDFKEATGIDLKEGFELVAELRAELNSMKEAKQGEALQVAATQLQQAWGVNDAEVSRRAVEVAAYVAKLPEATRAALDNVEGIQLAWRHIEASKATRQAQRKGGAPVIDGNAQTYSRKQVNEWMFNDPATYDKHSAAIAAARKAGRLTD
jgi:hypothetical protein